MYQELFTIPFLNIPIYGYGLMMVVAFLAAIQVAKWVAPKVGIDPEHFVNAAMIGLVAGIVGARLSHVLENLPLYTRSDLSIAQNIFNAINIRSGGLTFYGGFLLATPLCIVYAFRKKIPVLLGMDVVAICLMVALGFGRIGCFLNGCCYGAECHLPWAVHFPYHSLPYQDQFADGQLTDVPSSLIAVAPDGRYILKSPADFVGNPTLETQADQQRSLGLHPAQLYSTLTAFLIAGILYAFFTTRPRTGLVFALMLMIEGFSRFVLEMLRVEPAVVHIGPVGLSLSMVLGAAICITGVVFWVVLHKLRQRTTDVTSSGGVTPVV